MSVIKQSDELEGFTSVSSLTEENHIPGDQQLYQATVKITKGKQFKPDLGGRWFLCLEALERFFLFIFIVPFIHS